MVRADLLKEWLTRPDLPRSDRLFLVLATDGARPKAVKEVRNLAVGAGARDAKKWNISEILRRAPGAVNTAAGWELNNDGKNRVAEIVGVAATPAVANSLRAALANITEAKTHAFLEEAVRCCEAHLYRAAVVLSWVGAVSLPHAEVVAKHLPAFNAEAQRRDPKWRPAKSADGLARIDEFQFLQIIASLEIIGKNVKDELEGCLKLRNACGHPSSLKIAESRVAAHVELLMLNVFARFT